MKKLPAKQAPKPSPDPTDKRAARMRKGKKPLDLNGLKSDTSEDEYLSEEQDNCWIEDKRKDVLTKFPYRDLSKQKRV